MWAASPASDLARARGMPAVDDRVPSDTFARTRQPPTRVSPGIFTESSPSSGGSGHGSLSEDVIVALTSPAENRIRPGRSSVRPAGPLISRSMSSMWSCRICRRSPLTSDTAPAQEVGLEGRGQALKNVSAHRQHVSVVVRGFPPYALHLAVQILNLLPRRTGTAVRALHGPPD